MTSKEITKVIFNNSEISALYYGDVLVWEKENTEEYGVNTFAGKFTDDSTESDWYCYINDEKVMLPVNSDTKEFNFKYDKEIKRFSIKDNANSFERIDNINIPIMENYDSNRMFSECRNLVSLDASKLKLSNTVTSLEETFATMWKCTNLIVNGIDTSNITSMEGTFRNINIIKNLDISGFNTSNVTDMVLLFASNPYLQKLSLNFDVSKVVNMDLIFSACQSLTTVTGVFEGTKINLDLSSCPLTNASAMVFINGLSNVTETKTLSFNSSTYNTLTPEQIAVATSKGWTVISA